MCGEKKTLKWKILLKTKNIIVVDIFNTEGKNTQYTCALM